MRYLRGGKPPYLAGREPQPGISINDAQRSCSAYSRLPAANSDVSPSNNDQADATDIKSPHSDEQAASLDVSQDDTEPHLWTKDTDTRRARDWSDRGNGIENVKRGSVHPPSPVLQSRQAASTNMSMKGTALKTDQSEKSSLEETEEKSSDKVGSLSPINPLICPFTPNFEHLSQQYCSEAPHLQWILTRYKVLSETIQSAEASSEVIASRSLIPRRHHRPFGPDHFFNSLAYPGLQRPQWPTAQLGN